jgi:two-component system, LuxR family, response regulator FixJ
LGTRIVNDEATVFMVDDDPAALLAAASLVRAVFPNVKTFASAGEFLAAYRPGQPGCLVLDVAMPGMSGLELHRRLIRDKIALPVIYVTAYGNVPMAVEAMRMRAINFLQKPVPEQELWDNIRMALEWGEQNRRREVRQQGTAERLARLTDGERAVLELVLAGKRNREMAAELRLSMRSIEDRRAKLMKKMGAATVAELVQLATMQ